MHRTYKINIKKGHRLYDYFDELCILSKNLYNTTNFYYRQVFTGMQKEEKEITPLEESIIAEVSHVIPKMNKQKYQYYKKRVFNEHLKEQPKQISTPNYYQKLDKDNRYLSYTFLDSFFKLTKNHDYTALPSHSNQWIMKQVFQDWQSFYQSIKKYKSNPVIFTGRPKIPKYAPKNGRKPVFFSNQTCTIKNNKYLKLPKTKQVLNIGKLGQIDGKLQQVRVIPKDNYVEVEVVFKIDKEVLLKTTEPKNILGIDLGVNNFATISNNVGSRPVIVKGKILKSINYYYNQQRANYYAILRKGQDPKKGKFTSHRLQRLDQKRHAKIKDHMHKISKSIITYAKSLDIDTIVVGKNQGWKTDIQLKKTTKLTFVSIPYNLFIDLLTYKAEEQGIKVVLQEESYTSKASFLDGDVVPVYGDKIVASFSGKRITRGLYKASDGFHINADVNASYNILRKAIPKALDGLWNKGFVANPLTLNVAY